MQGRLYKAAATYAEAVQYYLSAHLSRRLAPRGALMGCIERGSESEGWGVFIDSPSYFFGLGSLLCEWNDLEGAEEHLTQGMDLIGTHLFEADEVWLGYAALARLRLSRGRDDQALAVLDAFLQLAHHRHIAPVLLAQAEAEKARIELARDNLPAALHWAATSGLSVNDPLGRDECGPYYPREREYLTLARVRIAEARENAGGVCLSEVLVLLGRLLVDAEAKGRIHSVLEILLLRALALEVQGDRRGALAVLGRVLDWAEPEGYVRLFLDEGPPMMALLRQAKLQGIAPGYSARLLATWNEPQAAATHLRRGNRERSPGVARRAPSLVEPLTCREREVLQLLLDGASNREIACQLVLSVNTVKKHVLNICGKLNTQSRAQAIVKAQALHLL
jgi:LuxR family maltose regulon positive regulatory protein